MRVNLNENCFLELFQYFPEFRYSLYIYIYYNIGKYRYFEKIPKFGKIPKLRENTEKYGKAPLGKIATLRGRTQNTNEMRLVPLFKILRAANREWETFFS